MHDGQGRLDELARGWRAVLAASVGCAVGLNGLAFYSFGLFVKPLSAEFGWSRGQISLGMSCIMLGTVVVSPIVGILIDRYGVRRIALPSLIGVGLAYCALSAVNGDILTFYAACLGVALLGCATSPVTWTGLVSGQFHKARGLALGLTMLGGAATSLIAAPILQGVMLHGGWRTAYLSMGGFALLVAFPIILFFIGRPGKDAGDVRAALTGMSVGQALRSAPFWILGVGIMLLITAQSGTMIHLQPLLTDRGIAPVTAAWLGSIMGITIIVSRVGVGALLDRLNPPVVAGVVLSMPVVSAILLATCGDNGTALVTAVLLLGFSAGAEIDLLAFFTSRYFGLRSYGRIFGTLFVMFSLGNGIGAPIVGAAFDHWGDYASAMWITGALFAVGASLFASLIFFRPQDHAAA